MPDSSPRRRPGLPGPPEIAAQAHVTAERYKDMYEHAARDPDGFWAEQARRIAWMKPPTKIKNTSFAGDVLDQMVRGRRAERLRLAASTGISRRAAIRPRSSGKATIPRSASTSPIASCTSRSAGWPTR